MRYVLMFLMLMVPLRVVHALDRVGTFEDGKIVIVLKDDVCTNDEVLTILTKKFNAGDILAQFKMASVRWRDGKDYGACYVVEADMALIVSDDGELISPPFGVPAELFKDPNL
jgi:hypothetical protein